ncbi:MAG: hypothetical protein R2932_24500 [Caldilineaceae bacterium]
MGQLIIWAAIAATIFYLFWPAMWVAPFDSIRKVLAAANAYAEEGHADPIFFNGTIYNGDPGSWFYPITLLWRTTPILWIGLLLALATLVYPFRSQHGVAQRKDSSLFLGKNKQVSIALLFAFACLFILFMNLGAKKFDRYLLPVYPMLDLAAGLGIVAIVGWIV